MVILPAYNRPCNLSDEDFRAFRRDGIPRWAARVSGFWRATPGEAEAIVHMSGVPSCIVFPYPGTNHARLRPDRPLRRRHWPRSAKYLSPPGSQPCLYVPVPQVMHPEAWVGSGLKVITEGEKKAVAACVHGLPTTSIPGVWAGADSWSGSLAPGFERLNLRSSLALVYDSDIDPQHRAFPAYIRLSALLMARGGRPVIVTLPALPGMTKTGLDDWFARLGLPGRVAFLRLLRLHPALQPTAADTGRAAVEILAAATEADRPLAVEAPAILAWLAALAYDRPQEWRQCLDRLRTAGWPAGLLEKLERRVGEVLQAEAGAAVQRLLCEYEGWIPRADRLASAAPSPAPQAVSAKVPTSSVDDVPSRTPAAGGRPTLDPSFEPEPRPTCGAGTRRFRRRVGGRVLELYHRLFCGRWDCPRCRRRFTASWVGHLDQILSGLERVAVAVVRDDRSLDTLRRWISRKGGDYFRVRTSAGYCVFSNLDVSGCGVAQDARVVPSHEARGMLARLVRDDLAVGDGHPFAASQRWQRRNHSPSQGWELAGILPLSPEQVKTLAASPQAASIGVRIRREGPDRLLLEYPEEQQAAWEQVLDGGGTALPQAA